MKFVIQCTTQASVTIDQKLYSEIGKGFLVLIGICDEDTKETADKMVRKLIGMRIFSDENGKTNLALKDVDGQLLLVYPVRGLQKRQPAVLCQSRITTACKRALRIHHRRLQKGSSRRENRRIRCGNGGRADQRRTIYNHSGFKRPGVSI